MLLTTEPVINTPIQPRIGDNIGNTLPAFEMPCPIALLKPPYVVIFEIAKMKQIGTSGSLLVASNTAGGVAAKLISPQSIAIATAAVKEVGKESELLKMTLRYSIGLLVFICIWTFILSFIL